MAQLDAILSKIDPEEVVSVARDLVGIHSITRQEGMGVVNYLSRWFESLGIPVKLYPSGDGRANFFAQYGDAGSGSGGFIFNGHQDTKPASGMSCDPFGGEIKGGRLYGRGACDMKGGVAALLCAFKALVEAGHVPQSRITFFSDIEEEYGGGGWDWAAAEGLLDGYAGLISCEPSELEVQIGNRGCFITSFETQGRSAHSGLAHLGINAIHNMTVFIGEYLELPYLAVENPYFGRSAVNFEKINGGLYLSAVPDRCICCVDSRLIPETPPEIVQRQVDELMVRLNRDRAVGVREVSEPEGWRLAGAKLQARSIAADHELVTRVGKAVERTLAKPVKIGGCPAMTIAMIAIERGTPAVICGPGSIAQAHTADEWVSVDQLIAASRIYATLMAEM